MIVPLISTSKQVSNQTPAIEPGALTYDYHSDTYLVLCIVKTAKITINNAELVFGITENNEGRK